MAKTSTSKDRRHKNYVVGRHSVHWSKHRRQEQCSKLSNLLSNLSDLQTLTYHLSSVSQLLTDLKLMRLTNYFFQKIVDCFYSMLLISRST